jgi:hypothetical protein
LRWSGHVGRYKWRLIASRPVGVDGYCNEGIQAIKIGRGKHRIEIDGSQLLSRPELV